MATFDIEAARKAGYSDEEIAAYMRANPGLTAASIGPGSSAVSKTENQITGPWRLPALAASKFVEGAGKTLGLPGTLLQMAMPHGAPVQSPDELPMGVPPAVGLPTSEAITAGGRRLGIIDRPDLQPQTTGERYLAAGAEGAGSAVPLALVGGGSLLPLALTGTSAGLASEGAKDAFPGSKWAPVVAGTVAGLGMQGAITAAPQRGVQHIVGELGNSSTMQEAGAVAQDAARNWLVNTLPSKLQAAWAPVDQAISSTTPSQVSKFEQALKDISKDAGQLAPVAQLLRPQLPERMLSALQTKAGPTGAGFGIIPQGQTAAAVPTWGEVQTLRSTLGDALSNPKVVEEIGAKNLRRLYGALTEDMRATAKTAGVDAAFDAANAESKRLYDFAEGTVGKLVSGARASSHDPLPEVASSRLLSAARRGGTDLQALRQEIPEAADELAAAHLRMAPASWGKLSPEAKEALVASPADREILDKFATQAASKGRQQNHLLQALLGEQIGQAGGQAAGNLLGIPGLTPAIGSVAGAAAPYVVRGGVNLLSNPQAMRYPLAGANAGLTVGKSENRPKDKKKGKTP